MDPKAEAQSNAQPSNDSLPSKLLIKLSNPYASSQQNDGLNNSILPSSSSLTSPTKHHKSSSKKEKKPKKSISKSDSLEEEEEPGSGEDNLEDSAQKSGGKRVYTKRTTDKIRRWTKEESKLYEDFIDQYSDIFNDPSSKRVTKIFIFMSNYIGTKTPSQCRSHHQKFFRRIQREKLLSSGKITNEEELEKLMPKKRKKKTDKNKGNLLESETKQQTTTSQIDPKEENLDGNDPLDFKVDSNQNPELNGNGDALDMNNEPPMNNINTGYFPEDLEQTNDNVHIQNQQPLFIENEGYGKIVDPQFMNFKRNYEALRKISMDDKEWMTLINSKSRRKSSISMLFNNNYYYQTDPELSNNLEFMQKPNGFLDDPINNPSCYNNPQYNQQNNMYNNYPPSQYYYCNHHNQYTNHVCYNNYPNELNSLNNLQYNEENINSNANNEEKSSALKLPSKPVVENQQILWNNAIDNVDVIDQYLKTVGDNS